MANTLQELKKWPVVKWKPSLFNVCEAKAPRKFVSLETKLLSSSSMALLQVARPVVDDEFLPDFLDKLFKLGKFSNPEVNVMFELSRKSIKCFLRPGNLTQDAKNKHDIESDVKFIQSMEDILW